MVAYVHYNYKNIEYMYTPPFLLYTSTANTLMLSYKNNKILLFYEMFIPIQSIFISDAWQYILLLGKN